MYMHIYVPKKLTIGRLFSQGKRKDLMSHFFASDCLSLVQRLSSSTKYRSNISIMVVDTRF
jgi:hypothetical protein